MMMMKGIIYDLQISKASRSQLINVIKTAEKAVAHNLLHTVCRLIDKNFLLLLNALNAIIKCIII